MPHATCTHCGTRITDHTTMREHKGDPYCCQNCVAMVTGAESKPGLPTCAHCEMPIVDSSTKVDGAGGRTFCCNNCAIAMAEGAEHRA